MALSDHLKQFLQSFAQNAAGQFNEISQLAIGGPQGYAQQQENERQKAQLAQALQMHNTMTPYEKGSLQLQSDTADANADQQAFQRMMDINKGIGQGIFQSAAPGDKGAITAESPYEGGQDISAIPIPKHNYTIAPTDPIGKQLGITQPLVVPDEKYFELQEKYQDKLDKAAKLAENAAYLQKQGEALHQSIDERFTPDYYKPLYGQADPRASMYARDIHAALNEAVDRDKRQGSTTEFQSIRNKLDTFQSPWEKIQEKRQEKDASVSAASAARADTREDRSYQFHIGELDKAAKPISDALSRVARLQDTVLQKTPQADSLIAPELLSVMAGGAGSGLRMNEAEISRIIGGRTNMESLSAALNKWQLDPSKGLQIPDAQRVQIRALLGTVAQRLGKKQDIIDTGRGALVRSTDPMEHRRILDQTNRGLSAADSVDSTVPSRPPLVPPPPPR